MLGILGGTFDPIHYGHLSAAWQIFHTLKLTELRLMPCHLPPHRELPTRAIHRIQMLQLAIQNVPGFSIDARELNSEAISYTVNSLAAIRSEVGNKPVCLLLGMDAFNQLASWHRPEQLLQLAHLVIVARPEVSLQKNDFIASLLPQLIQDPGLLKQSAAGYIYFASNTTLNISSTLIRRMQSNHQSPRFLLPDAVLHYIEENKLYF